MAATRGIWRTPVPGRLNPTSQPLTITTNITAPDSSGAKGVPMHIDKLKTVLAAGERHLGDLVEAFVLRDASAPFQVPKFRSRSHGITIHLPSRPWYRK